RSTATMNQRDKDRAIGRSPATPAKSRSGPATTDAAAPPAPWPAPHRRERHRPADKVFSCTRLLTHLIHPYILPTLHFPAQCQVTVAGAAIRLRKWMGWLDGWLVCWLDGLL